MKNTNEIIKELGDWASEDGCGGCGFKVDVGGMCVTDLLLAARRTDGDAGPVRTVRRGDHGAAAAAGGGQP